MLKLTKVYKNMKESNKIFNEIKESLLILEEDNDFMIDSFLDRLKIRITKSISKNKFTINNSVIETIINETLSSILHDTNKEICEKYKKLLEKIYSNLYEQIIITKISKTKLKKLITIVLEKIKNSTNTSLTPLHFNNFKEAIVSKIAIYDSVILNDEINKIIESSSNDIVNSLNENNNEFLIKQIESYIRYLI